MSPQKVETPLDPSLRWIHHFDTYSVMQRIQKLLWVWVGVGGGGLLPLEITYS